MCGLQSQNGCGSRKQYKTALRLTVVPIVHIWKTKYPGSYIASVWRGGFQGRTREGLDRAVIMVLSRWIHSMVRERSSLSPALLCEILAVYGDGEKFSLGTGMWIVDFSTSRLSIRLLFSKLLHFWHSFTVVKKLVGISNVKHQNPVFN